MSKVQDVKKSSLTFAPEAGSQRLRDVINKGLTEEEHSDRRRRGLPRAAGTGSSFILCWACPQRLWRIWKEIALLSERIAEAYYEIPKDQRNGKVQMVASTSFFVPKPFTPFQWARMCTKEEFLEKARVVNHKMREIS